MCNGTVIRMHCDVIVTCSVELGMLQTPHNFEELELKGAQTEAAKTANLKNGLSKLT